MGENGSVLVNKDGSTIVQPAILAPKVVDTTGAGDTFTAAYAVALIERHSPADALRFAGTLSLQVTMHLNFLYIFIFFTNLPLYW
jgi:sugar/nucleoside kinase (ribokinase family)